MKKYVMLTADIHPIGGMQLYTAGKADYLTRQGWQVYILYCGTKEKNCSIVSLNNYVNGGLPALAFRPAQLSEKFLKVCMEKISAVLAVEPGDTLLVESQAEVLALWGELIAQKYNAKHICFNCNEQFRGPKKYYEENIEFFKFKYGRRELLGLHNDTNKKVFDGYMDVPCSDEFLFDAVEPGPIQDVDSEEVDCLKREDFNIAYLGRISKGYVPNIIEGVAEFAKQHYQKSIQFIIIGNAEERMLQITSVMAAAPNVIVTYMGDMVPIPRSIYAKLDVMIAGAVCAEISAREGVPTIVADCENYLANGVLGYTVNNSMYYDPDHGQRTFAEELENVLINQEYLKNQYSFPAAISPDEIFESHFAFFDKSSKENVYFDVLQSSAEKLSIKQFCWLLTRTYMPVTMSKMAKLKRAFLSKRNIGG